MANSAIAGIASYMPDSRLKSLATISVTGYLSGRRGRRGESGDDEIGSEAEAYDKPAHVAYDVDAVGEVGQRLKVGSTQQFVLVGTISAHPFPVETIHVARREDHVVAHAFDPAVPEPGREYEERPEEE